MLRIAGMLSLVALISVLSPDAYARVDDGQWKEIKAEFERFWADKDPEKKTRGIIKLGMADRVEAVKILLKLLAFRDPNVAGLERKREMLKDKILKLHAVFKAQGNKGSQSEVDRLEKMDKEIQEIEAKITSSSFVRFNAIKALANTRDADALNELHKKGVSSSKSNVSAGVIQALGMANNESSRPFVRAKINASNAHVATSAIDSSVQLKDTEAVPAIIKQLKHSDWQVRSSATRALSVFRPISAVGPLVDALQKESGRLQEDIDEALEKITFFSFGGDPESWKRWYESNGANLKEIIAKRQKIAKKEKGKGKTVSFYGIESKSTRLCFVIDVSGSMQGKAGAPDSSVAGRDPNYPTNANKLAVAKYELINAIKGLPEAAYFNIIHYSTDVKLYSARAMVKATRLNKVKIVGWIRDTLQPEGATNIFDALDKAFKLAGNNPKANYKQGIDTIFFLTDGIPGGAGRIRKPAEILTEITMRNKTRKIKIHVVGVGQPGELDVNFLKALAEQNGGKFVHRK